MVIEGVVEEVPFGVGVGEADIWGGFYDGTGNCVILECNFYNEGLVICGDNGVGGEV